MKTLAHENRKGVSPLIGTVLVVALTLTVAAVLVPWVIDFARNQIVTITTSGEKKVNCIDAGLELKSSDIGYDTLVNPKRINATIKNSGLVNLYSIKMQFRLSDEYSGLFDPSTMYNESWPIRPGEKKTLNASNVNATLTGTLQAVRIIAANCDNLAVEVNI